MLVLVVVIAFLWWRSKSKATLRYQAHKDALDAGRTLLARYGGEGQIQTIPLEYRGHARTRLENIKAHVDTTMVPAELGNVRLFQELLEDVTWVQMATSGNVPAQGRTGMRAMTFTEIFTMLERWVQAHEQNEPTRHFCPLDEVLPVAAEALSWFRPGDTHPELKVSPTKATDLYARAQALAAAKGTAT